MELKNNSNGEINSNSALSPLQNQNDLTMSFVSPRGFQRTNFLELLNWNKERIIQGRKGLQIEDIGLINKTLTDLNSTSAVYSSQLTQVFEKAAVLGFDGNKDPQKPDFKISSTVVEDNLYKIQRNRSASQNRKSIHTQSPADSKPKYTKVPAKIIPKHQDPNKKSHNIPNTKHKGIKHERVNVQSSYYHCSCGAVFNSKFDWTSHIQPQTKDHSLDELEYERRPWYRLPGSYGSGKHQ